MVPYKYFFKQHTRISKEIFFVIHTCAPYGERLFKLRYDLLRLFKKLSVELFLMASSSSSHQHKRKRSTHVTDYFTSSQKYKSNTHKRTSSSNKYPTQHRRTSSLPINRTIFSKSGRSNKSYIPRNTKQNIWSRQYSKIPNNNKYNPYTMSTAANGGSHVKASHDLKPDVEDSKHHYETRLIKIEKSKTKRNLIYKRNTMTIKMNDDNKWPCWTINLSALSFKPMQTYHFDNIGFRHKSIVDLKKTSTTFLYQTNSVQPWDVRIIVWTHQDFVPFNRPSSANGIHSETDEHEITGNLGFLEYTDETKEKCQISWTEPFISMSEVNQAHPIPTFTDTETNHSIDFLLTSPTNTKYPSTPFYWSPSDKVGVIYDNQSIIPPRPDHLDSDMFIHDTWQKLPGLVEYKDSLGRGGQTTAVSCDLKYAKNTYMTVIWQPGGRHSGNSYPSIGDNNALNLDVIHTLYWNE